MEHILIPTHVRKSSCKVFMRKSRQLGLKLENAEFIDLSKVCFQQHATRSGSACCSQGTWPSPLGTVGSLWVCSPRDWADSSSQLLERCMGAKWDPWAEPLTQLQPKPLLRRFEGTKHQGAETALRVYSFLGLTMISSDAGMMLCPLGVTFIQNVVAISRCWWRDTPRRQCQIPHQRSHHVCPLWEKERPWCAFQSSVNAETPPFSPLFCSCVSLGCMAAIRRLELLGLFGCSLTHDSLASPPAWLPSAFVGSQHIKG